MQTATQYKTVIEPYMSSTLVRRETKHTLLTREEVHPDLMGLSCLVMDECFVDYTYHNKRRCT
ncbi:MAG: hypothetical protein HC944_03300 [Nanoarchaeota archaeon]|nr:hypothetical protein [Nanoarchaeota archaeon]